MEFITACALTGALLLSGGDITEAIKKDKAALQGAWKVTDSVSKGEKVPADEIKALFLIFKGDAILVRQDGKDGPNFTYLLDPLKKVKEMDLTLKVGPQKGRVDRAIYHLDGDTLKICIQTNKDEPRPREFESRANSELWLIVLQRVKE